MSPLLLTPKRSVGEGSYQYAFINRHPRLAHQSLLYHFSITGKLVIHKGFWGRF